MICNISDEIIRCIFGLSHFQKALIIQTPAGNDIIIRYNFEKTKVLDVLKTLKNKVSLAFQRDSKLINVTFRLKYDNKLLNDIKYLSYYGINKLCEKIDENTEMEKLAIWMNNDQTLNCFHI